MSKLLSIKKYPKLTESDAFSEQLCCANKEPTWEHYQETKPQ
ncbi:hypothetical protein DSUL_40132 [Desulfovibrionales bacterium]